MGLLDEFPEICIRWVKCMPDEAAISNGAQRNLESICSSQKYTNPHFFICKKNCFNYAPQLY